MHPTDGLIAATTIAAATNALRNRGLRVSAARRLVLEALFAADRPISADDIAGGLDGRLPPSDLASVYRNLDVLEGAGLAHHVHLGHGPGLWAKGSREYALCESCGDVRTFDAEELDGVRAAVEAVCGYAARFSHFPLVGRCVRCCEDPSTIVMQPAAPAVRISG
jgi:Fur family transcriptional regulator, ferric uptake regulator